MCVTHRLGAAGGAVLRRVRSCSLGRLRGRRSVGDMMEDIDGIMDRDLQYETYSYDGIETEAQNKTEKELHRYFNKV